MAEIILNRLALMLVFMIPGYILLKKGIISDVGSKDIAKLLVYIILPCAVINSYNMEFSAEKAIGLLLSFFAAAACLLLSIIVSGIIFGAKKPIENFGAAFSNAGFMGIPLVSAVIGEDAVYYAAAFVAVLNVLQWTYGVYLITGSKSAVSTKKILLNPVIISFFIGIILFAIPLKTPDIITQTLGSISQMNAPIAMLTIGMYLAEVPIKELFTDKRSYAASAVRLLLIPMLTLLLLLLVPFGEYRMEQTVLILAAAPIGSNVAVYARLYGGDYKRAVKETVLSTLLSVASMPAVIGISEYILQNSPQ